MHGIASARKNPVLLSSSKLPFIHKAQKLEPHVRRALKLTQGQAEASLSTPPRKLPVTRLLPLRRLRLPCAKCASVKL